MCRTPIDELAEPEFEHQQRPQVMGVIAGARLSDTQHAFDGVAPDYDRSNRENPVLALMRQRVIGEIERCVPAGLHILDLGCGPGT